MAQGTAQPLCHRPRSRRVQVPSAVLAAAALGGAWVCIVGAGLIGARSVSLPPAPEPVPAESSVAPPGSAGAEQLHLIGPGDTVWGIAETLADETPDATVAELAQAIAVLNPVVSTEMLVGQELVLP